MQFVATFADSSSVAAVSPISQDIIEEMIMPQWFVDVTDMARRSVEAVEKGELKILPEFHVKTWHQVSRAAPRVF